mmetsp:Transcript_25163/g.37013  ORF Transcript_25163/g.37013 Transcript_25163/m.37013 type:complete len:736 (-) Transcript_25163:289-2496(-)|eukprot:CAMPEP_0195529352 /NCGR_PEP_ID=MMETSP0794_2-20130614/31845_1 /TAXON_ID=515487 /ORGANISM="Stephanopyxis turris, Strain CCMP 815" /LENGTH=735 /DNA_ID=CAMNT_0040660645 /DNA_START=62 /DNA_END=2269 /DNA_ORIENTATION=+
MEDDKDAGSRPLLECDNLADNEEILNSSPTTLPIIDEDEIIHSEDLNLISNMASVRTLNILSNTTKIFMTKGKERSIEEAFRGLDIQGNNRIDREDLEAFFEEASHTIKLPLDDKVINAAIDALIEDVGGDDENNYITRDQFAKMFQQHPELYQFFEDDKTRLSRSQRSSSTEVEEQEDPNEDEQVWVHAKVGWKNWGVAIVWLTLYICANIGFFTWKAVKYANTPEAIQVFGNCIIFARGFAQVLNFNAFVILLPICRHFMTMLRFTKFRFLFPFDTLLEIHMLVGTMIGLFSLGHVSAHICDYTRFVNAQEEDLFALLGDKLGPIPNTQDGRLSLLMSQRASITGIIMVVCLIAAYSPIPFRRKNFNTFWYLHHLLFVFLIALCIHGTGNILEPFQSVYWVMVPLVLYLIPRFYRESNCKSAKVLDMTYKHGEVIALRLEKPASWKNHFRSGMYAFINVPEVSRTQWHPFSLTSSPFDDFIEFNFKVVGDWTKQVDEIFEKVANKGNEGTDSITSSLKWSCRSLEEYNSRSRDEEGGAKLIDYPIVKVEGPMGASSQGFRDYPVVVLVGAGIGVTPMISVLRGLMADPGKMRRTLFYWTVRDCGSFDWFGNLMDDIYDSDQKHVLQIRHFLTSAKRDDRELADCLLNHARRAKHKRSDIDIFLGRRTHHMLEVGRPNWDEELENVQGEASRLGFKKCGVFLCGPEKLGAALTNTCTRLSKANKVHLHFTKETF